MSAYVRINALAADRADLRAFVMACAVLGVQLRPVNSFCETRSIENGKDVARVSWWLEQKSATNPEHKTNKLRLWWNDPAWLKANPGHPLAQFKEYWEEIQRAEAHENSAPPLVRIQRGKKHVLIPVNATPEKRKSMLKMLE